MSTRGRLRSPTRAHAPPAPPRTRLRAPARRAPPRAPCSVRKQGTGARGLAATHTQTPTRADTRPRSRRRCHRVPCTCARACVPCTPRRQGCRRAGARPRWLADEPTTPPRVRERGPPPPRATSFVFTRPRREGYPPPLLPSHGGLGMLRVGDSTRGAVDCRSRHSERSTRVRAGPIRAHRLYLTDCGLHGHKAAH